MPKRIPAIKKGEEYAPFYAIVDDEDYEYLSQFKWKAYVNPQGIVYAGRTDGEGILPTVSRLMHKMITGFEKTDHINRNGLDNRRTNLRECNQSQNGGNAKITTTYGGKPTSSQYKGVKWDKNNKKWMAQVFKDGKQYWLGRFKNELDAARAYDAKAKELFGEFARPNFP